MLRFPFLDSSLNRGVHAELPIAVRRRAWGAIVAVTAGRRLPASHGLCLMLAIGLASAFMIMSCGSSRRPDAKDAARRAGIFCMAPSLYELDNLGGDINCMAS